MVSSASLSAVRLAVLPCGTCTCTRNALLRGSLCSAQDPLPTLLPSQRCSLFLALTRLCTSVRTPCDSRSNLFWGAGQQKRSKQPRRLQAGAHSEDGKPDQAESWGVWELRRYNQRWEVHLSAVHERVHAGLALRSGDMRPVKACRCLGEAASSWWACWRGRPRLWRSAC